MASRPSLVPSSFSLSAKTRGADGKGQDTREVAWLSVGVALREALRSDLAKREVQAASGAAEVHRAKATSSAPQLKADFREREAREAVKPLCTLYPVSCRESSQLRH